MPIPIIDLFAGPGGLAEGFSSLTNNVGDRIFKIKLSIEKDSAAHETLTLRSFVRQFPFRQLPEEYYRFVEGEISLSELYRLFPDQYLHAADEAWQATLGETSPEEVDQRISTALNNETDWVLIGGPPCQAYSNAGRSRVGGISEEDHRVYLYKEYLRIIARHHPAVFVMENVEGLLSAKLNDEKIFGWILRDLSDPSSVFGEHNSPGYRIYSLVKNKVSKDSDYLIRAEDFGIPQNRHRVILIGIRDDILKRPGILSRSEKVDLKSVIGLLPKIRSGISRSFSHSEIIIKGNGLQSKKRYYSRFENSFEAWREQIAGFSKELLTKLDLAGFSEQHPETMGSEFFKTSKPHIDRRHSLAEWYTDQNLTGITHHVSRSHLLQDLKRYLFAALYTEKNKRFPKLYDYKAFDEELLPDHGNVESGKFTDRFRVQLPNSPATTVTSHISKDGHYFIHFDPIQCRSLTVREAARIQTFPDNYIFCGNRTDQYHQVGNAVPPYLAFQIADIVSKVFNEEDDEKKISISPNTKCLKIKGKQIEIFYFDG
ncbi:DNA cytosine methyltransferase [Dyadobacter sp. 50-39]|uniref:DNA cytosine methyltransferase n=1 Tax=Dyadobacter sp. 50-39 TaxID=1895756 RepID=UPI0009600E5A|nr:DNA cytosine methyltransferase [Dyadobacter sp. 50-39]OJV18285.1 MAG: DNA (cytosine-5-)-methyltransferase [Dyadobacter sp. 50-39]